MDLIAVSVAVKLGADGHFHVRIRQFDLRLADSLTASEHPVRSVSANTLFGLEGLGWHFTREIGPYTCSNTPVHLFEHTGTPPIKGCCSVLFGLEPFRTTATRHLTPFQTQGRASAALSLSDYVGLFRLATRRSATSFLVL